MSLRVDILYIDGFQIPGLELGPHEAALFLGKIPAPIFNRIPMYLNIWQIVSLEVYQEPHNSEKNVVEIISTVSRRENLSKYINGEAVKDPVDIKAIKNAHWRAFTNTFDDDFAAKIKSML